MVENQHEIHPLVLGTKIESTVKGYVNRIIGCWRQIDPSAVVNLKSALINHKRAPGMIRAPNAGNSDIQMKHDPDEILAKARKQLQAGTGFRIIICVYQYDRLCLSQARYLAISQRLLSAQ